MFIISLLFPLPNTNNELPLGCFTPRSYPTVESVTMVKYSASCQLISSPKENCSSVVVICSVP